MKFNNKENEKIVLPNPDGRTIWLSRAVAVVATICIIKDNHPYFLISKRGEGSADYQGMWNLVCGYLDNNESSGEAFIREVWEETGVNILDIVKNSKIDFDHINKPWDVNTNPNENRQNVSLHHGFVAHVKEFPKYKIHNTVEQNEVSDVKWVSIDEIENYDYAFNHLERLKSFILLNNL